MQVISAADQLMAIFGYHRVQCQDCTHSVGTGTDALLCNHHNKLVERTAQCAAFSREPGCDE